MYDFLSLACISCNKPVRLAILESLHQNLFDVLPVFTVLGSVVAVLAFLAHRKPKIHLGLRREERSIVPLISTSIILGIGIGGFIDGIILHQILQWHEMFSNKLPPTNLVAKSVNMFWDGVFHVITLIATIIGVVSLFSLFQRTDVFISKRTFFGGMFFGWGLFNIIEGIIDHHLLKLHNVREISQDIGFWNYSFLAVSAVMIVVAAMLILSDFRARKR